MRALTYHGSQDVRVEQVAERRRYSLRLESSSGVALRQCIAAVRSIPCRG